MIDKVYWKQMAVFITGLLMLWNAVRVAILYDDILAMLPSIAIVVLCQWRLWTWPITEEG